MWAARLDDSRMASQRLKILATLSISLFATTVAFAQAKKAPGTPVATPAADKKLPGTTPSAPAVDVTASVKEHVMVKPKDIKWVDAPPSVPKGAKIAVIEGDPAAPGVLVTFRLKLPNGWTLPPHFHPADEHVTVIKGTFNMGMGDTIDKKAFMANPVGSFMIMPKGSHHYARAKGETIIQVHAIGPWGITYVNPADDPRTKGAAAAATPATPATPAKPTLK